jgi:rfaE bifunctional protein kinase chain/domain
MRGVRGRRLVALVRRLRGVRVLVVGDLMLDHFIRGRVERISPEAPVPVVHVTDEEDCPGGAGNVVSNVAALGGRASIAGIVGRDAAGARLRAVLEAVGADTSGIVAAREVRTIRKTRIIAHHQQVVRFDREEAPPPDGPAARRLQAWVLGRLRRVDVLVVSDYGKGTIGPALLEALAAAHARRPFTWVVDPKRSNFPHYRRASLVKPNLQEAAAAAEVEIRDAASLRTAGTRLLARWDAEAVLVSRGEQGMALFRRGHGIREFASAARDVFDVTGAGDTVVATCALALGAGATLEEAAVLANHAAGIVVGKSGTATITAAELAAAVRDG